MQHASQTVKKIIIDVTHIVRNFMLNRRPTGVRRVGLAYIEHYGHCAQALYKGRLLSRAQSDKLFASILVGGSKHAVRLAILSGCFTDLYLDKPERGFLINPSFDGLEKPGYVERLNSLGVKPVFVVYDLIPISHPEYCVDIAKNRHFARVDRMLESTSGAICISTATSEALTQYAGQSNQRLPATVIAPLASAIHHYLPGKRLINEPYFVILGTIEPRKNHALLLQIWRDLVEQLSEKSPRLVIIGQRGWKNEHVVNLLEHSPLLKEVVIELSDCSDQDVTTYLHHAEALLFPSFVEGYGLPIAEALMLKTPVIASDLPVFREIAGDIPDYAHPLDGMRWRELILAYAEANSLTRDAQLLRMRGIRLPTWDEHFGKVNAFLDSLDKKWVNMNDSSCV